MSSVLRYASLFVYRLYVQLCFYGNFTTVNANAECLADLLTCVNSLAVCLLSMFSTAWRTNAVHVVTLFVLFYFTRLWSCDSRVRALSFVHSSLVWQWLCHPIKCRKFERIWLQSSLYIEKKTVSVSNLMPKNGKEIFLLKKKIVC